MERIYITLVRDGDTKDDIVLGVRAETPDQVRSLIEKFYQEQEWGSPTRIQLVSYRANAKDPILFVGHAHAEYRKLEDQVKSLCERLMQAADWLEGEGSTGARDELYQFVEHFEIGKRLIAEKYASPVDWKAIEAQSKTDLEAVQTDKDAYAFIEKYLNKELQPSLMKIYQSDRHAMGRTPRQALDNLLSLPPL